MIRTVLSCLLVAAAPALADEPLSLAEAQAKLAAKQHVATTQPSVEQLSAENRQLRAEVAALKAEIAQLKANKSAPTVQWTKQPEPETRPVRNRQAHYETAKDGHRFYVPALLPRDEDIRADLRKGMTLKDAQSLFNDMLTESNSTDRGITYDGIGLFKQRTGSMLGRRRYRLYFEYDVLVSWTANADD